MLKVRISRIVRLVKKLRNFVNPGIIGKAGLVSGTGIEIRIE